MGESEQTAPDNTLLEVATLGDFCDLATNPNFPSAPEFIMVGFGHDLGSYLTLAKVDSLALRTVRATDRLKFRLGAAEFKTVVGHICCFPVDWNAAKILRFRSVHAHRFPAMVIARDASMVSEAQARIMPGAFKAAANGFWACVNAASWAQAEASAKRGELMPEIPFKLSGKFGWRLVAPSDPPSLNAEPNMEWALVRETDLESGEKPLAHVITNLHGELVRPSDQLLMRAIKPVVEGSNVGTQVFVAPALGHKPLEAEYEAPPAPAPIAPAPPAAAPPAEKVVALDTARNQARN